MADEVASVELTADADDFDRVLDQTFAMLEQLGKTTADIVKASGVSMDTALGGTLDKLQGKIGKFLDAAGGVAGGLAGKLAAGAGKVQGLASMLLSDLPDLAAGQMAELNGQLFAEVGGKIGTMVGGPAGLVIGRLIGEQLADVVPVADLLESVQDIAAGVGEAFDGSGDFLANTQQDVRDFFRDTREAFREFNFGDLLAGDLEAGFGKVGDLVGGVLDDLWGKVELFVGRIANGMDRLWLAIREPFAKLADFAEKIFVKIGVLPEATGKWGESIRSVGSIATEVFRGIGYAVGFLEGLCTKLGGYVGEYVISPMLSGLQSILGFVQDAFATVARNIGGAVGRAAKETSDQLKVFNDALKKQQAQFDDLAKKAAGTEIFGKSKQRGDDFAAALDLFKQNAAKTDAEIAELRKKQAAWLNDVVGGIFARAKADAQDFWATFKSFAPSGAMKALAPTLYEGGRDTLNTINLARSGENSVADQMKRLAERQAKAAEDVKKAAEEGNKLLQKLLDWFEEADVL